METLKHHDFKIGMPDGWVDASHVILVGPREEEYSPTITVTREPLEWPISARAYATEKRSELQEQFGPQGYEVLEEAPLQVGGLASFQRTHTWMLPDAEIQITQMQVYLVKEDAAVVVTCTDRSGRFDDRKAAFMEAVQQFEFIEEQRG